MGFPIFLLNDTKLVDSNDDLWDGSIDIPLGITESGSVTASPRAWSGTQASGIRSFTQELGGISNVVTGLPNNTSNFWIRIDAFALSAQWPLYAISAPLPTNTNTPSGANVGVQPVAINETGEPVGTPVTFNSHSFPSRVTSTRPSWWSCERGAGAECHRLGADRAGPETSREGDGRPRE